MPSSPGGKTILSTPEPSGSGADGALPYAKEAELARFLLRQRRRRETMLGAEHFADPVWDMMLDLFIARVHDEEVATSSLIIAANVPQSTALRRIRRLVADGVLVARADPHDGRRTFVRLSDVPFKQLAALLQQWLSTAPA